MNSIVISFLVILFSVLVLIEFNLILLISMLLIVFILNVFIVSVIVSKCKQNDKTVQYFELKTNRNINYNSNLISVINKPFIQLKQICFNYVFNKFVGYLSRVEKTLSEKPFCGKCLDIKTELEVVSTLITDNYVQFWYQSIGTDNNDFEIDCQLILQKMFLNLFERCQQKLNKQSLSQKVIVLVENHLNYLKNSDNLTSNQLNESLRVDSIIERLIRLSATEEIVCVLPNPNLKSGEKSQYLSLFLMIKAMLRHSVFIPIVDIISDQKFIYENLFNLITNFDLKLNHNIQIESQFQNTNPNVELFINQFNDQIQDIDSNDKRSEESDELKLFSDICEEAYELSENESNDELIVEAIEADEDIDQKIISNLVINKTVEINDSKNSSYILYFIEYDGLFQQTIDSQIVTNPLTQEINLFKRRVSVQRRFSEFVSLQKVLERNKSFKRLMKGIKKPSSIQITAQNLLIFNRPSNTRLDSSTVEFRRIYLQNYLKQLSHLKAITESEEFRQFLAFESDGSIAFVGNNQQSLPLNVNNVLLRGVKGAISIMKTALPVEPQIGKIDPKFSERTIPENEKLTIKLIATNIESNHWMQLQKKLNIWSEIGSDFIPNDSFGSTGDNTPEDTDRLAPFLGTRTLGDGCEQSNVSEFNLNYSSNNDLTLNHSKSSLSINTIDSIFLLITKNIDLIERIIYTNIISVLFGSTIERFICELVSRLLTKEMFVRQIHSLHSAIWPTNESEVQNEYKSVENNSYLDQTVDSFIKFIEQTFDEINPKITQILEKLSTQQILVNILIKFRNSNNNKLFYYQFFELILNEIQ